MQKGNEEEMKLNVILNELEQEHTRLREELVTSLLSKGIDSNNSIVAQFDWEYTQMLFRIRKAMRKK